jgi:hypothetical protein
LDSRKEYVAALHKNWPEMLTSISFFFIPGRRPNRRGSLETRKTSSAGQINVAFVGRRNFPHFSR